MKNRSNEKRWTQLHKKRNVNNAMIEIIKYWYVNGERSQPKDLSRTIEEKELPRLKSQLLKQHNANEIYFTYKKLK